MAIRKKKATKFAGKTSVETPKKRPLELVTFYVLIESRLMLTPRNPKKLSFTCLYRGDKYMYICFGI